MNVFRIFCVFSGLTICKMDLLWYYSLGLYYQKWNMRSGSNRGGKAVCTTEQDPLHCWWSLNAPGGWRRRNADWFGRAECHLLSLFCGCHLFDTVICCMWICLCVWKEECQMIWLTQAAGIMFRFSWGVHTAGDWAAVSLTFCLTGLAFHNTHCRDGLTWLINYKLKSKRISKLTGVVLSPNPACICSPGVIRDFCNGVWDKSWKELRSFKIGVKIKLYSKATLNND